MVFILCEEKARRNRNHGYIMFLEILFLFRGNLFHTLVATKYTQGETLPLHIME